MSENNNKAWLDSPIAKYVKIFHLRQSTFLNCHLNKRSKAMRHTSKWCWPTVAQWGIWMAMAPAGLPLSTGSSSYLQGWVTSNIHDPKDRVKLRGNIVLFSLKILWLNKAYSFKWVRVWTEHISNGSGVPSVGHSCRHCHFIMQWKRLAFGSVTEGDGHALRRKWFKAHCLSLNRVIGQSEQALL